MGPGSAAERFVLHRARGSNSPMASDAFRFFRTWLQKPRLTGAVAPSGKALARAMAAQVPIEGDLPVLELGPGTGVVTAALIERGIAPERIVAVEFNPDFCALIGERYRGVNVVEGDAYNLDTTLPAHFRGPFAAVVSSLPLLNQPHDDRVRLISSAVRRTGPGGGYVQFSYGFGPPVKAVPGRFAVRQSAFVLANIPPARVWVYRAA
jgi:phosphatidylethanolamine/phosphatidyl-N-methylethanolamine N-methyltransferase